MFLHIPMFGKFGRLVEGLAILFLLVTFSVRIHQDRQRLATARPINAVVKFVAPTHGGQSGWSVPVYYRYTMGGRSHTGMHRFTGLASEADAEHVRTKYAVGRVVPVYVSHVAPGRSSFDPPVHDPAPFIMVAIFSLAGAAWAAGHKYRLSFRRQNKPQDGKFAGRVSPQLTEERSCWTLGTTLAVGATGLGLGAIVMYASAVGTHAGREFAVWTSLYALACAVILIVAVRPAPSETKPEGWFTP